MCWSPKPARPQAQAERGEGSCCTVCPSPGGAVPAGPARSREKPGSRTRSAAEGEHRTGDDFSAAALDQTSQALGQGPPCIGDGRAMQHPRAADSTNPPWHVTALHGQFLACSWSHFRARKPIEGADKRPGQAKRAAPVRARRRQESKVCHQAERDATGGSMRSIRARPGLPAGGRPSDAQ